VQCSAVQDGSVQHSIPLAVHLNVLRALHYAIHVKVAEGALAVSSHLSFTMRSRRESVNPLTDFLTAKNRAEAGIAGVFTSTTAFAPPSGMSWEGESDSGVRVRENETYEEQSEESIVRKGLCRDAARHSGGCCY
jgi:hypothetical protein